MSSPPQPGCGRPRLITESDRVALVALATSDAEHRRMSWPAIAFEYGSKVRDHKAIRRAFADSGYNRRIAWAKPFINAGYRADRLAFALRYYDWDVATWMQVVWTDECSFNLGGRH